MPEFNQQSKTRSRRSTSRDQLSASVPFQDRRKSSPAGRWWQKKPQKAGPTRGQEQGQPKMSHTSEGVPELNTPTTLSRRGTSSGSSKFRIPSMTHFPRGRSQVFRLYSNPNDPISDGGTHRTAFKVIEPTAALLQGNTVFLLLMG